MFQSLDHLIKLHGDDAEDHDGCDYHVKLEQVMHENDRDKNIVTFSLIY